MLPSVHRREIRVNMDAVTLDQAIDAAMQLPPNQREMLVTILRSRQIESRRQEIARDAQESIAAFRARKLRARSAEEVIADLRQALEDDE
jgi:hypothetical protein